MEEKHTDHTEVSNQPNYNYASSAEGTIAHDDTCGQNGTYGESNVNQVDIQGKHLKNLGCLARKFNSCFCFTFWQEQKMNINL